MKKLKLIFGSLLLFWFSLFIAVEINYYNSPVNFYLNEGYSLEVSRLFAKTELCLYPETQEYLDYKND